MKTEAQEEVAETFEPPRLIELGSLREIIRGVGSSAFDSLGDSPSCTTSNARNPTADTEC